MEAEEGLRILETKHLQTKPGELAVRFAGDVCGLKFPTQINVTPLFSTIGNRNPHRITSTLKGGTRNRSVTVTQMGDAGPIRTKFDP